MDLEKLLALLAEKKAPGPQAKARPDFLTLVNAAPASDGKSHAALYLYDEISWWSGNDAQTFRDRLNAITADVLDVHINSPGGAVFEGFAIYNMLVAHPARVIVHIDGLAASIASVIAQAGDEIRIAENAMVMIHDPSVMTAGQASDLRKTADVLDALKESILNTYETRTGMDRATLSAMMADETWLNSDESVAQGFATEKVTALRAAAKWSPEDFPTLPDPAKALAKGTEPPAPPALVGTVEDVQEARDKAARLKAKYAF